MNCLKESKKLDTSTRGNLVKKSDLYWKKFTARRMGKKKPSESWAMTRRLNVDDIILV